MKMARIKQDSNVVNTCHTLSPYRHISEKSRSSSRKRRSTRSSRKTFTEYLIERERTLFATQIRTTVIQYNNSLAWQVARKGIKPIELATFKKETKN